MGAAEEIQEIINNRLFSQKKVLRHRAVGIWGIYQRVLSTFNMSRTINHISKVCQDSSISLFYVLSPSCSCFSPPVSHILCFFSPHKSKGFREISSLWAQVGILFVNPSCGQWDWPKRKVSLGFLTASSKAWLLLQQEGDGIWQQRRVWSGHGRNGTASTFHTSFGLTANFLYRAFDWKHIQNIFSWLRLQKTMEMRSKIWLSALS